MLNPCFWSCCTSPGLVKGPVAIQVSVLVPVLVPVPVPVLVHTSVSVSARFFVLVSAPLEFVSNFA